MSKSKAIVIFCALLGALVIGTGLFGYHGTLHLPGHVSKAHARFETACQACHKPWSDSFEAQCMKCHERALMGDSHSSKVMAKPVKAQAPPDLANLDCVNCHKEHVKKGSTSYTGPSRFCVECHKVGSINQDHIVLEKYSCSSKGCHSYHFNFPQKADPQEKSFRLLPESKPPPKAPKLSFKKIGKDELLAMQGDEFYKLHPITTSRYEIGPHFETEATCNYCHKDEDGKIDLSPSIDRCSGCHEEQAKTFAEGRHGAPYGLGIAPTKGDTKRVDCGTCHNAHSLRLEKARRETCLTCHKSAHVVNSLKSLHSIYLTDPVFKFNPLKGADCATCHMPKLTELNGWTNHNESWTSINNGRMANVICSRCHGIIFALKSLSAKDTVESGFTYSPEIHN